MRRIVAMVLTAASLGPFLPKSARGDVTGDRVPVRVRLESSLSVVRLHGMSWRINGRRWSERPLAMETLTVRHQGGVWRVTSRDIERTWAGAVLVLRGEGVRSAGRELPGTMILRARKGSIDLLGEWPMSEYLAGVLAGEVPLSWPMEALKAQAVAARSYALATLRERPGGALEATVSDQVFKWPLKENERRRALEAVQATQGWVLVEESSGSVAKAHYHADCGGRTVPASQVWGGRADSGVTVDPSCPLRSRSRWEHRLRRKDLAAKVEVLMGPVRPEDLEISLVTGDGRVSEVLVRAPGRTSHRMSGDRFRHLLGVSDLRSTFFEMEESSTEWVFTGRGFGHGVGLCQWGSRDLGERGLSAEKILAHYYPRLRLDGRSESR